MVAEFIDRPIAGRIPEKHFGKTTPYSKWIRFIDDQYKEWVGSFAEGWEGYISALVVLEEDEKIFVVANGNGYLIDMSSRALLNDIELTGIKTAIADKDRKKIIFSDGLYLKNIDFNGQVSILFNQYYFDDIELTEIRDNKLYARYWHYQRNSTPFLFELDLNTKEVKDSYNDQFHRLNEQRAFTIAKKQTILKKIAKLFKL